MLGELEIKYPLGAALWEGREELGKTACRGWHLNWPLKNE